jgi:hypothetical protein
MTAQRYNNKLKQGYRVKTKEDGVITKRNARRVCKKNSGRIHAIARREARS